MKVMKIKITFLFVIGFLFFIFSCKKNHDESLRVMIKSPVIGGYGKYEESKFLFSGDQVLLYNLTTGEIRLIFLKPSQLISESKLSIFLNDKCLLDTIPVSTSLSSYMYNDLVFYFDFNKFYLLFGYPPFIPEHWQDKDKMRKEREENFNKRKEGYDIFIEHLKKNGKIVE